MYCVLYFNIPIAIDTKDLNRLLSVSVIWDIELHKIKIKINRLKVWHDQTVSEKYEENDTLEIS